MEKKIYCIDGPTNISIQDFIKYYTPIIVELLDMPDIQILVTDLPGVGMYTCNFLKNNFYRNGTIYHVGDKPRHNICNFKTKGGYSSISDMIASMRLDATKIIDMNNTKI